MGNQTFCNCIDSNINKNNLHIIIDNCTQENPPNYYEDISKSNLIIPKNQTENFKKSNSSKHILPPKIKEEFGKKFSFQDPELSFVTINMKNSKN